MTPKKQPLFGPKLEELQSNLFNHGAHMAADRDQVDSQVLSQLK